MTVYRHTQVGVFVLVVVGIMLAFAATLLVLTGGQTILMVALAFFLVLLVLFGSLTVGVSEQTIRVRFGLGPIGRSFAVSAVQTATPVRNPWYYGWGIRWFPRGWLYNVSGLDAVEIVMRDGKVYRIGTDEPEALHAAIQRVLPGPR